MTCSHYYLILSRTSVRAGLLTLTETARNARVHPGLVERMVDLGLIEPEQTSPELLFNPAAVAEVKRAWRLRNELGVNWAGVGLVLDLLERIRQLERELERRQER